MDDSIRDAIKEARYTHSLFISDRSLSALPEEVRELRDLKRLHLTGCAISGLPDWVSELDSLEHVDLANNPIAGLPKTLGSLTALKRLGLSSTKIGVLDECLRGLQGLEALFVPSSGLRALPPWIGTFQDLQVLDLGGNPLETLPPEFSRLRALTHLYLWGTELQVIPDALHKLKCLEVLDLSREGSQGLLLNDGDDAIYGHYFTPPGEMNRIIGIGAEDKGEFHEVPPWLAESLPRLRALSLGGNRLRSMPDSLPGNLRALLLEDNAIESFPAAVLGCEHLELLSLRRNRLSSLPTDIERLHNLHYLAVGHNPLPLPPEMLEETTAPAAIVDLLKRMHGPTRRLNQAKLLVVGEGSVGKTSLIRRLVTGDFSEYEQKTDGISVSRWGVEVDEEEVLLNIWDFGGQEIMHATHQFFLTKRSLYVLVIDARQGEEQNRLEYWLKLIQSFGGNSPIVIVANKTEECVMDVDQRGLKAKYPNIVDILPASCKAGDGLAEVADLLALCIQQMPHVRDLLPATFFEVKRELEELDANYITYAEYEATCERCGVNGAQTRERLVGFLHDLGTVLCFRDDPRLSDTNILNPDWVTSGVYRILNSHLAAQNKGLLLWRDIDEILDGADYPAERRPFIIDMMKRFELCYESEGTFLVPDLLTKQEPDTGSWDDALSFEIRYDVLPSSIISRLIVRMHQRISRGTVWRTGVVVTMDRNRACVRADREDATLRIVVDGPPDGRRGLLTAIRAELRDIVQTIPGLVWEERVPVPGHSGVWVPYVHLVDLEAAGHEFVIPQGLTDQYRVRDLLAGVEAPSDRGPARAGAAVGMRRGSDLPEAVHVSADPTVWKPADALRLAWWLLTALVVLVAVFIGAEVLVGAGAAAAITAASLAAIIVIASIVLRSSGRLSERGLVDVFRQVLSREG